MEDWADERAAEWLEKHFDMYEADWENLEANLAALLREVRASGALLVRAEILREQESKL